MGVLTPYSIAVKRDAVDNASLLDSIVTEPSFHYLHELTGAQAISLFTYYRPPATPDPSGLRSMIWAGVFIFMFLLLIIVVYADGDGDKPVDTINTPRLYRAPGFRLLRIAEFLFSSKVFAEMLQPPIVDLQTEYIEAVAEGRKWKRRWVLVRGYWSVACAAVKASSVLSALKVIKGLRRIG
ncbi:MAG TPA: hypothetical protein VK399_11810 [Longimicrobiaceae bacterium]|nr:hypothetical protein [Longimicrobiaceae bacterium]